MLRKDKDLAGLSALNAWMLPGPPAVPGRVTGDVSEVVTLGKGKGGSTATGGDWVLESS